MGRIAGEREAAINLVGKCVATVFLSLVSVRETPSLPDRWVWESGGRLESRASLRMEVRSKLELKGPKGLELAMAMISWNCSRSQLVGRLVREAAATRAPQLAPSRKGAGTGASVAPWALWTVNLSWCSLKAARTPTW